MDDAGSPAIGLSIFFILVIVDAILHGFAAAFDNVNDSQFEKEIKEGNKRAIWLKEMVNEPYSMIHILQIMITFVSIVSGIFQGRICGAILARFFTNQNSGLLSVACQGAVTVVSVFLLVTIGIIAPQKIAVRKAKTWVFRLSGIVRGMVFLFTPFGFLSEKASNLIVKICGLDPNQSPEDVTEEEIISMVKEGQEQGVLMTSEAEMIHNIIEFGDKDAKDIMTHRKNIVAVDGCMSLAKALEFMLEKNNSRFPVYQENIDNIIGVAHIKDAMIKSRDASLLEKPLCQVPGVVRETSYIPETRSIDSLLQAMQLKKNHMVIVVDEYGQTAGLVAMEDILEVIVGSILDEYDEDDNMIIEHSDGSYLMKGMAPLNEVCEILGITCSMEDYDTLNGYLISLIGKIPGDHETFQVKNSGYLFEGLSVEHKMIQLVKVTKITAETDSDEHIACQEIESVIE